MRTDPGLNLWRNLKGRECFTTESLAGDYIIYDASESTRITVSGHDRAADAPLQIP
jgi:hypothetical protein